MGKTRRTTAGFCALLLVQSLLFPGVIRAENGAGTAVSEERRAEEETTEPETTEKGNARRQTEEERRAAQQETEKSDDGGKTGESGSGEDAADAQAALTVSVDMEDAGELAIYAVELQMPEAGQLRFSVPDKLAVKEVLLEQGEESSSLPVEEEQGIYFCSLDETKGAVTCRIIFELNEEARKHYMETGEEMEAELGGTVSLTDRTGSVLAEAKIQKETLKLPAFLEKEAKAQDRSQKVFLWTDWINLGVNPGKGYLAVVIEDLEAGHHFDFPEGQIELLNGDGEKKEAMAVTEIVPQRSGGFGEIFTADDARELLDGISGAGFYTFEEDDDQQNGILLVPIDGGEERIGVTYRTRVSSSEKADVYQWDTELECGSKFLWEQDEETGQGEGIKENPEEEKGEGDQEEEEDPEKDASPKPHPQWEILAKRIPEEKEEENSGRISAASVWLTEEASCSLVRQEPGEAGYDPDSGIAQWELFLNQNGEEVQEAVIVREIQSSRQSFAGALTAGENLEAVIRGKDGEKDLTVPILPEDEWEKGEKDDDSLTASGYFVLEQKDGKERLEIHLFELGTAGCQILVETQVKDGAFAGAGEDFEIASGHTSYTVTLGQEEGKTQLAEGECETGIPADNIWIQLKAEDGYDYQDHSLALEMTINPQNRRLTEQQAAVTLSDGLEQVKIQQVFFRDSRGKEEDITDAGLIRAEEKEPDEQTGESQVIFSWTGDEDSEFDGKGTYRICFDCRMSEDMRNESFRTGEEVLFAAAQLTGRTGEEGELEEISGADSRVYLEWNSAAVSAEGVYREVRYSQEDSPWNGTRMPRVDWTAVVNRNEGDLEGCRLVMEWPKMLEADAGSLRIWTASLEPDGTLGDERSQIWPAGDDAESGREYFSEEDVEIEKDRLTVVLPAEAAKMTVCVELTAFARSDMDEGDFSALYRLERDGQVLEEGDVEISGARRVSVSDAAEKNQIPSAVVHLESENADRRDPYGLAGASLRLIQMETEKDQAKWEDYQEGERTETVVTGENGEAVFLFLEPDTLYKIETEQQIPGYESWEKEKYLVVLDKMNETDFPKADGEHELCAEESQVQVEEKMGLSRWETDEETIRGGRLAFFVEDESGNPLENVKCTLTYAAYEDTGRGRLASQQAVSSQDGRVIFDNLDPVEKGREGYEIHVTAPYGREDPAEFSVSVTAESDGTFRTETEGKTAEAREEGIFVTCFPAASDICIPVTDQNGNLLTGCGLELKVERLEEIEESEEPEETEESEEPEEMEESEEPEETEESEEPEETEESEEPEETEESEEPEETEKPAARSAARYVTYQQQPTVREDGSGYITLTDIPYGTYRVFGGRSIMTLIVDESGVEGWLEPVEEESEQGDRRTIRLELEQDKNGVYCAGEQDGWFMEEYIPRAQIRLELMEEGKDARISGGRFLIYETWSDRLVGELKEDSREPGFYELAESEYEDNVSVNDRGVPYIAEQGILPGTYAVWQIQTAEGYRPEEKGVWYFSVGAETESVTNGDLIGGNGEEQPFENGVIRCTVPFSLVQEMPEGTETQGMSDTEEKVTVSLKGTAWGQGSAEEEYLEEIQCKAEEKGTGSFEQVPVGIYILRAEPEAQSGLKMSSGIQVQVQYDGQVIFRTIGGRILEEGQLTFRRQE